MVIKKINLLDISPYLRYIHADISDYDENADDFYWTIPWRCIYDYELIFIFGGNMTVKTENDEYILQSSDIHIMPPFLRHIRFTSEGRKLKYYSVHFDLSYMGRDNDFSPIDIYCKPCSDHMTVAKDDTRLFRRPFYTLSDIELPQKMSVTEPLKYLEILNSALKKFEEKNFGYELDLKVNIIQLLRLIVEDMHLKDAHMNLHKNSRKLIDSVNYINNYYNQDINLDEFAIKNGFTPNYFRRLFKISTGKSPMDYIINLRIDRSIDLMRTGMYSISEISALVGYHDVNYFSRLFKMRKGNPPSKFLKRKY